MTEEEKKAMEYAKYQLEELHKEVIKRQKDKVKGYGTLEDIAKLKYCNLKILLNLIEKMQKQIEIKDNYMKLILDILYDYDGYFSRETNKGSIIDLADLIDETCDYLKKAILNDDKSDVYESYIE